MASSVADSSVLWCMYEVGKRRKTASGGFTRRIWRLPIRLQYTLAASTDLLLPLTVVLPSHHARYSSRHQPIARLHGHKNHDTMYFIVFPTKHQGILDLRDRMACVLARIYDLETICLIA